MLARIDIEFFILARLFGESYLAYRSRARRWIPYLY